MTICNSISILREIFPMSDHPLLCMGESGPSCRLKYNDHFWDETEWGVGNNITQNGIHSFSHLG